MIPAIKIQVPADWMTPGTRTVVPVIVDWFPRLTEAQILQNTLADMDGRERPHIDRNCVDIQITVI